MPIVTGRLPITSVNLAILDELKSAADMQIVSDQLNAVLRETLISAANSHGLSPLANVLQNIQSPDLAADQNLSLRDFVTKYATIPSDPAANKAAQAAIATLSSTTTVGEFLGLDKTIAENPAFTGIVAQAKLAALLSTSPELSDAQLQTDFIQKYMAFRGSTQDFWNQLSQDTTFKAIVPELQFTMQLAVLTLNNPQLVSALRETYKLGSINGLTNFDVATLTQLMTQQKISVPVGVSGSTPTEQLSNYASGIVGLLRSAFPTDYVAKQLADSKDATLQSVARVLGNAPDIDLQSTNLDVYLKQNSAKAFQNIPPDQVKAVTAQLAATQRVFRFNNQPTIVSALLESGMDSAAKISAMARSTFVSHFSSALGGSSAAQSVYAAASHINAQTLNVYSILQSGLKDVSPRVIANPNLNVGQAIQQQIPNWQVLFGSTSYCTCGECDSVYGPAAYFVDLLQFLRNSATNGAGFTPLDILIGSLIGSTSGSTAVPGRRPDLPYIKLDCQNSSTPLPYVDLVNEILESYVSLGKLDSSTAHNTPADATTDELLVNPEYTIQTAYATLAQAVYPLLLPYDRFLDIARSYLAFLGGDRRQVLELFQTEAAPFDTVGALAAETLGLSQAEFKLIANWDFVSGSATTPPPLNSLYAGNAQATSPWETWISNASVFLQQTGLAFDDLVNLLETQFINPGQTISLTGAGACDITQTVISPLDDPTLTKILPFVRLWRKLGWSMSELDKVLQVFAPAGITRGCLLALADFARLQAQFNLPVTQLLTLWSAIDTDGRDSLYLRLFQNKAVLNPVDPALQLSYRTALAIMPTAALPPSVAGQLTYDGVQHQLLFIGRMTDDQQSDLLSWVTGNGSATLAVENLYQMRWAQGTDITPGPGATITDATPAILAGLRISTDDLGAIRTATGLTDTATKTPLTLANLSQLYRYTILAQALGLSIPDLISLIALTGIDPFQLAPNDPVMQPSVQFVRAAQAVLASPFSSPELNYVYRAVVNPAAGIGPLETNVDLLAITLQTGLSKIAAANSYTLDPTGKILRQKLGTVVAASQLDAAMGLIAGTGIYKASLSTLPTGITFPDSVVAVVSYDTADQVLEFAGAMTDAQKSALALSGISDYVEAVSSLYQQPRAIISNDLTFLDPSEALSNLITSPLPDVADRYAYVLQSLLADLIDIQSRSLVQQSITQSIGLNSAIVALLLAGDSTLSSPALLKSQRDTGQPAIIDFLDLRDSGLMATLFSDMSLTVVTGERIDTQVNATGVANPGGARWQGKVEAEFSETYTFYVTANDSVRLWVNGQLLIEQWTSQAVSLWTSSPVNLNAGELYDIRLEYYNASATATIALGWSSKSTNNNVSIPIPANALFPENTFLTLNRLYPLGILLGQFGMKADEVAYLSSHPTAFEGIDPHNSANIVTFDLAELPLNRSNPAAVDQKAPAFFDLWSRLNGLFSVRNSLPAGNTTLFDIFRVASGSTNPASLSPATTNAILAATGWDATQFATLSGETTVGTAVVGFGLSDADFVNTTGTHDRGLIWLQKCLSFSGHLGVPALQLFLWANQTPDLSQSNDIKNVVKAEYDDSTWTTVGKPLNDKIRDNSKSALIAFVLNMTPIIQLDLTKADDLYTYFLIDVQMSPCMQTSRIVQATAAIQLFVQRCLLNLENDNSNANLNIGPDAIDAAQWEWRKNYRIWEANREVFLYPENWIDPTLRDNRTPFFQDLQSELQQGPVTADVAESAFQNYLTKLLEVSRLETCGFFYENDTDANVTHNIFHVFGRTYATPHIYYYRTLDRTTGVWSAWETVNVDIQGDHLIPVVWNRRLYIFWPIFKEVTTPNSNTLASSPSLPLKNLQIRFAWSEYRDRIWSKKQVTADSLIPYGFVNYSDDFDPSTITFNAQVNDPALTIDVYKSSGPDLSNAGAIIFDGCSADPTMASMSGEATFVIPARTVFDYMNVDQLLFSVNLGVTLTTEVVTGTEVQSNGMVVLLHGPSPLQILNFATPQLSLSYAEPFWPNTETNGAPPFFLADTLRTYLVTQQNTDISTTLIAPGNAMVPYSAQELNPPADGLLVSQLPIFETAAGITASVAPLTTVGNTTTQSLTQNWEGLALGPRTRFTFTTHRHAHICDFLKALNWQGVPGLLTLDNQTLDSQDVGTASTFYQLYQPTNVVNPSYPSEQIDFSYGGSYSNYNWEVFFHIPLLIATQLSQNQQFEDAEKWFRYIFNPSTSSTDVPARYWNVLPFNQDTNPQRIEDLANVLAYTGSDPTILAEQASFKQQITAWQATPFDPDLIARMRIVAYQKATVMKCIDHHLAWGDFLYRQFTRESVNEATLHYVLCRDILGDRPVMFPTQGIVADKTYADLVSSGLDAFSDTLVTLENLFPFTADSSTNSDNSSAATGIAVPYFCFPPNDTLLGYWDTVAQRLYQIRHCMNIAGQVQQLPLFAPPINPGDLIHALEMGMDLTSALSDISAATPFYRFAYMLPKALELCAEVRSLGASLLSALEKSDAEALSMLRATQETALMKAVRNVKQQQFNEADSNLDALNDTLGVTQNRLQYYQSLIAAGLNTSEKGQFTDIQESAGFQTLAQALQLIGSSEMHAPDAIGGAAGMSSPVALVMEGGSSEGSSAVAAAGALQMLASLNSTTATLAGLRGTWDRRAQEWQFQTQTATLEIQQINDQIKAAQARVDAAQADLDNQDLQISNSSDVEAYLRTKYTNQALYDWMVGQVSSVYFQCYQMAYDLAKRAEACFVFERMPDLSNYTSFIQFGYWDSLKKGLLSGERLYQDLKRLEIAYMDQHQRGFEIAKSISLLLLDPMALINLKETGYCTVQFPEALFDMDYPGHYLRRIMLFSMTAPCVVGPYTSFNCTLTLASNKIRVDNFAADAKDYIKDSHFVTNFAASESIATSSGQNDSGLFVVNFNDERYLPFEGAGVISTWQLSMPPDTNAFDFDTITDIIFNLKYTARDGGTALRSAARAAAVIPPGSTTGATSVGQTPLPQQQTLSRMFSLRHEFPSEWNAFLHPPDAVPDQTMTINLTQERFPFQYRGKKIQIYEVDLFLKFRDIYDPLKYTVNGTPLGDYATTTALTLNLTLPAGAARTVQLVSNTALLAGIPSGSVPQPPPIVPPQPPPLGPLGSWTIVAKGTDIGAIASSLQTQVTSGTSTNTRLAIGAIEDVFLVCRYLTN